MNVSMLLYCIIGNVITLVCQLFSQHFEVIFDALLASVNIYFIPFYRIEWLYKYNFTILGCDLYAFITFLYVRCLEPKTVIRISQCCMAVRNPLAFPILKGTIVVFSMTLPSIGCACLSSFPDMREWKSVHIGLS